MAIIRNKKTTITTTNTESEGEHPVGTGIGAAAGGVAGAAGAAAALGVTAGVASGVASGAATGALAGTPLGPVGTTVGTIAGGVAGALVGGLIGKDIAEAVNPTDEETYWEKNYTTRPYVTNKSDFEPYRPAYRYGVDSYVKYQGRAFNGIEPQLRQDWNTARGNSMLSWDEAKPAASDAYGRVHSRFTQA